MTSSPEDLSFVSHCIVLSLTYFQAASTHRHFLRSVSKSQLHLLPVVTVLAVFILGHPEVRPSHVIVLSPLH